MPTHVLPLGPEDTETPNAKIPAVKRQNRRHDPTTPDATRPSSRMRRREPERQDRRREYAKFVFPDTVRQDRLSERQDLHPERQDRSRRTLNPETEPRTPGTQDLPNP